MSNNNKAQRTPVAPSATTSNTTGNMGGGSRPFHTKPSPWQPLRVSSTSAAGHHAALAQQKKRLSNASHNSAQSKDANGGGDSVTTGVPESNHSSLSSIHEQVDLLPPTNGHVTSSSGTTSTLSNRPQQQRRGSAIAALQNALNNSAPNMEVPTNGNNSHAIEQRRSSLSHALAGGGTDAAMGRPRMTSGIVGRRRSSMASTGSHSSNPYIPRGDSTSGEGALAQGVAKTRLLRRRSSGDYSYGSGDETAAGGGSDGVPRRAVRRRSRRISHTDSRAEASSKQQSRYQRRLSADNVSTAAVYHGLKGPDVQSQLGLQLQMVDAKQSRHHHRHAKHPSPPSPPRPTAAITRRTSLDLVRHAKELAEAESNGSEEDKDIDGNDARVAAFMAGEDSAAGGKNAVRGKVKKHVRKNSDFDGDSSGQLSTISSGDEEGSSVSIPRSRSTDSFDDRGDELAKRFEQSLGLHHHGQYRTNEGEKSGEEEDDDDSIDLNDIPFPPPIISDSPEKRRSDTNLSSSPPNTNKAGHSLRNVSHDETGLYLEKQENGAALGATVDHHDAFDTATIVSQAETVLASNVNKNAPRLAQARSEGAISLPTQISTGKKKATSSRLSGKRSDSQQLLSNESIAVAAAKPTRLKTSNSLDVSSNAVARSSRHGSAERRAMRGSRLGRRSKSAERRTLRGSNSHGKAGAQAGHHAHPLWAAAPMKRRGSGNNAA